MKYPPHLKASPVTGHLKQFKNDPINFMLETADTYPDIALFKILGKKIYFLNNPDYVEHILQKNYKNYHKSPSYNTIRLWGGTGIFTSDGEEWLRRRKFYQPAFTNSSIQNYTGVVLENAAEMMDDWENQLQRSDQINISMEMTKVTMQIISETLFSTKISFGTELWENTTYALEWIGERILRRPFVLPVSFPSKANKKFHAAVASMDKVVYKIIEDKKKGNQNDLDLLSRLMDPADDKKLKPLNEQELRDEVMTLFIAGHETSANVLSWTYYMLATKLDIQEKVYQEIAAIGDRKLVFEDMHNLVYTVQVLSETMRLYPPVWHMGRLNLEDDEIGGYHIPKGSHLRISPLTMHRNKDRFENPDVFDPERFTPEKARTYSPFEYLPFGAGPRLCAGRNFAMMEMVLIVAETIRKFKFSYEGKTVEMAPMMTLRSKGDINLKVEKR